MSVQSHVATSNIYYLVPDLNAAVTTHKRCQLTTSVLLLFHILPIDYSVLANLNESVDIMRHSLIYQLYNMSCCKADKLIN